MSGPHDGTAECCDVDADLAEAAADESDPTMSECCRRDISQQRRSDKLRFQLSLVDRSMAVLKVRNGAVPSVATSGSIPSPQHGQTPSGDVSEEDADDPGLEQLRRQRMSQMQSQAAWRTQLQQQGHGQLVEANAQSLVARLESTEQPSVLHLAIAGHLPCELLDEHLGVLAARHLGTLFVRVTPPRKSALQAQLRVDSLPALVCCVAGGVVVGRASLAQFGGVDDIIEEEVTSYLTRLKVLSGGSAMSGLKQRQALRPSNAPSKHSSGGQAAYVSSEEDPDDVDDKVCAPGSRDLDAGAEVWHPV
ncbi:MAG: hypothetical protein WDW38_005250 [Sanguina aurantia]